jgi:hypothetical protein
MSDHSTMRPTVARIWRGRTTKDRADEYEAYSYEAGIKPLMERALGVQYFRDRLVLGEHRGDVAFRGKRSDAHPSSAA